MFEGVKSGGTFVSQSWREVGNEYHRFKETGDVVEWDWLVIYARDSNFKECSICLEDIKFGGTWSIPCGHKFHTDRLFIWANMSGKSQSPTCPMCRSHPEGSFKTIEDMGGVIC